VVPFAPGGATDITGRAVGAAMSETLKQGVVVENRAGGGGIIGADVVAKAPPDGYTVLLGTPAEIAILPHLQKLPYDPLRDSGPGFARHVVAVDPRRASVAAGEVGERTESR
jgi:tripartite-type tricarboxylate transporter receptor subunit TctC